MPLPPLPSIFLQRPASDAARLPLPSPIASPSPPPSLLQAPEPRPSPHDGDGDSTIATARGAGEKRKKRPRAAVRHDKENATRSLVGGGDGDGDGDGGASVGKTGASNGEAAKARKPTYLLQKEERDVLVEEMRALEKQLETLKLQAGLPTRNDHAAVATMRAQNFEMEEQIHASRLFLAKLQSFVMQELHTPPVDPLATFIHLPEDPDQRRAILRGMRDFKLQRAEEVAHERLHHVDHSQAYLSDERFTTNDGIYHSHRLEITQLPNFKSARQLYDALSIFFYNWEISVSEMLNQLAIREDSDEIDPTIWNQRIVTVADDVGCPEELNTVVFARFRSGADGVSPVGVITHDSVDIDDLHPYRPLERTCKFLQSVHVVYELPVTVPDAPDQRIPILKSCAFVQQLPPQCPLAPGVEEKLHEHMARWPNALIKFLRAYNADADTMGFVP